MSVFFNPAGPLTVNKLPYALGGGRLGDSGVTFDPAVPGTLTFVWNSAVTSGPLFSNTGAGQTQVTIGNSLGNTQLIVGATGATRLRNVSASQPITFELNAEVARFAATTGNLLIGDPTDRSNGKCQLLAHSTVAGGIGFGNAAGSIFKSGAAVFSLAAPSSSDGYGALRLSALQEAAGGNYLVNGQSIPNGWGVPTGTYNRTTFDSTTVTLANLAARVAALINDLHRSGVTATPGPGHGLLIA